MFSLLNLGALALIVSATNAFRFNLDLAKIYFQSCSEKNSQGLKILIEPIYDNTSNTIPCSIKCIMISINDQINYMMPNWQAPLQEHNIWGAFRRTLFLHSSFGGAAESSVYKTEDWD